jgi:hypothetical protein
VDTDTLSCFWWARSEPWSLVLTLTFVTCFPGKLCAWIVHYHPYREGNIRLQCRVESDILWDLFKEINGLSKTASVYLNAWNINEQISITRYKKYFTFHLSNIVGAADKWWYTAEGAKSAFFRYWYMMIRFICQVFHSKSAFQLCLCGTYTIDKCKSIFVNDQSRYLLLIMQPRSKITICSAGTVRQWLSLILNGQQRPRRYTSHPRITARQASIRDWHHSETVLRLVVTGLTGVS